MEKRCENNEPNRIQKRAIEALAVTPIIKAISQKLEEMKLWQY